MRNKIVWEKWKDPMLSNYDETEWPGYDMDENGDKIPIHTASRQPVMHTPFGMVSVVEDSMASTNFDFWVMHTNFDITDGLAYIIEQVPGVETLEVNTRYRARIGFPRSGLFRAGEVMNEIDKAIQNITHTAQNQLLVGLEFDTATKAMEARDGIEKKHEHWAIWIVPNGNLEILGSDTIDDQYRNKLQVLKQAQEAVGGRLLTSESE